MQDRQFLIITHRDMEPLVLNVHREIERTFAEFEDRYGPDLAAQMMVAGSNPIAT